MRTKAQEKRRRQRKRGYKLRPSLGLSDEFIEACRKWAADFDEWLHTPLPFVTRLAGKIGRKK